MLFRSYFLLFMMCHESGGVFSALIKGELIKPVCAFIVQYFEQIKRFNVAPEKVTVKTSSDFDGFEDDSMNFTRSFRKLIQQFYGGRHYAFKKFPMKDDMSSYFKKLNKSISKLPENYKVEDLQKTVYEVNKWFNVVRKNKIHNQKTPYQIAKSEYPGLASAVFAMGPYYFE